MNKKLLLALVLIVAVIGIALYYLNTRGIISDLTTVPDRESEGAPHTYEALLASTSTWPTYVNEEYGYQINYPPGADVSDGLINLEEAVGEAYQRGIGDNEDYAVQYYLDIRIAIVDNPDGLLARDWAYQNEFSKRQAPQPLREEEITINGTPVYYYETSEAGLRIGDYVAVHYYFEGDNRLHYIRGVRTPGDQSLIVDSAYSSYIRKYEPIFMEMVNSFELAGQAQ